MRPALCEAPFSNTDEALIEYIELYYCEWVLSLIELFVFIMSIIIYFILQSCIYELVIARLSYCQLEPLSPALAL